MIVNLPIRLYKVLTYHISVRSIESEYKTDGQGNKLRILSNDTHALLCKVWNAKENTCCSAIERVCLTFFVNIGNEIVNVRVRPSNT